MVKIEILQAVPAAGKTKAVLTHIKKSKNKKFIVASISCQLNKQSFDYYNSIDGTNGIIIDTDHINRRDSVASVIKSNIGDNVLFITHAALLDYPNFDDFLDYELFIDEVPDFVQLHQMKFTDNLEFISKYCDITNGKMTMIEDHRDKINKIAVDGLYGNDVISESIFSLARTLLQGIPVVIKDNIVYFIDDKTIQQWDAFKTITISCANFYETFTGVILKDVYKWEFVDSKLSKYLDFKCYPNTSRIEIIPMYDGNWSRYAADKIIDESTGETVYNKIKDTILEIIGNTPFIYTNNSYRSGFNTNKGQYVAYNPHGLNTYMNTTNAVALFSYNPLPWQIEILKGLSNCFDMDKDKLINSFLVSKYLEPCFQLCLRTDIRNKDSDHKVTLVVPDMRCAEYLKTRYLHNAKIDCCYMIKSPDVIRKKEILPRNVKLSFIKLFNMNKNEIARFYRLKNKLNYKLDIIQPEHIKYVENWINDIRKI